MRITFFFVLFIFLISPSAKAQFIVPFSFWKSSFGNLTISEAPLFNYGILPRNSNFDKVFTVTNDGTTDANNITGSGSTYFNYKGGTYPGTNGTCASFLTIGSSCTIVITANSGTTTGTLDGHFSLSYSDTLGGPYLSRRLVTGYFSSTTVSSIFVTPSSGTFDVGNTQQLKCFANTSDGGVVNITESCAWTTNNAARVTVNNTTQKGLITGVAVGAAATITATYGVLTGTATVTVAAGVPVFNDPGIGLYARYFSTTSAGSTPNDPYSVLQNNRIDATVDFNWASGANPAGGLDDFGGKWTGQITAGTTGVYCVGTRSDDGVRLWIDNTLVINNWTDHSPTDNTGTFTFTANVKYDIFAEFYENGGGAEMRIRYVAGACGTPVAVTQANLYPVATRALDLGQYTAPRWTNLRRGFALNGTVGAIADATAITGISGGGSPSPANATASNTNGSGMAFVDSVRSQAILFDGVDDYISVAASVLATGSGVRTLAAWVKPTSTGATMPVAMYGTNTTNLGNGFEILSDGRVRQTIIGNQCDSTSSLTFGTYSFVAMTLTGTTSNIYINGALDSTCTFGGTPSTATGTTLYIGRDLGGAAFYSGEIDDIGFWNLVLTAGEVNTLFERGRVINPP
jgi:hypothetical protein